MNLSIIIPWFDVGDVHRQNSWHWLRRRYEELLPDAELVCGGSSGEDGFSRSRARNSLVQQSTRDILLIADADTVFHEDQILEAVRLIESGVPWVIPYGLGRYYNLTRRASNFVCLNPVDAEIDEPKDPIWWDHKIDSWAGLIVLSRAAFEQVGGYDERFVGWGYEDNAFRYALDRRIGPHVRVDNYVLHLWHPAPEEDCFGQPNIDHNRALYRLYENGILP